MDAGDVPRKGYSDPATLQRDAWLSAIVVATVDSLPSECCFAAGAGTCHMVRPVSSWMLLLIHVCMRAGECACDSTRNGHKYGVPMRRHVRGQTHVGTRIWMNDTPSLYIPETSNWRSITCTAVTAVAVRLLAHARVRNSVCQSRSRGRNARDKPVLALFATTPSTRHDEGQRCGGRQHLS